MKKTTCLALNFILLCSLFLYGCSSKDNAENESFDETTVSVSKNGEITEMIVAGFDKEYYSAEELKGEFVSEISTYNQSKGADDLAQLSNIEVRDGNVYVTMQFKSFDDYEAIQKEDMFVGTINDAYDAGYSMNVTLKGTVNGDKIGKVEIMGMKDKHIVIISEPVKVKTYRPISYVSANVEVINEKEARVNSESGGLAYLVLDK